MYVLGTLDSIPVLMIKKDGPSCSKKAAQLLHFHDKIQLFERNHDPIRLPKPVTLRMDTMGQD